MQAVSIVGYKNSGKSFLVKALATHLESKGMKVGIAKFTHHRLDKEGTDTASFIAPGRTVIGLGSEETCMQWGEKRYLPDLLPLLTADILLVEGGKGLGWLPRVLCLRNAKEVEALQPELSLATYGTVSIPAVPSFLHSDVPALAEHILQKAFLLPGLDCGACGDTCAGLSQRILQGNATTADCKSVTSGGLSITINNTPVGMNPFVERIIGSSIKGMLSELKGYAAGEVVIRLSE